MSPAISTAISTAILQLSLQRYLWSSQWLPDLDAAGSSLSGVSPNIMEHSAELLT